MNIYTEEEAQEMTSQVVETVSGILENEDAANFAIANVHAEEDALEQITVAGEVAEEKQEEIPNIGITGKPVVSKDEVLHKAPRASIVRSKMQFSLGGESKIGITRTTKKKDPKKVSDAKKKMAKHNNKKHRHTMTKKEHAARRAK